MRVEIVLPIALEQSRGASGIEHGVCEHLSATATRQSPMRITVCGSSSSASLCAVVLPLRRLCVYRNALCDFAQTDKRTHALIQKQSQRDAHEDTRSTDAYANKRVSVSEYRRGSQSESTDSASSRSRDSNKSKSSSRQCKEYSSSSKSTASK